jgi:prevent-host-death family protein
MRTAGVRELKENASELVRLVREEKEEIEITYRGKVVARLVPVDDAAERARRSDEAWARFRRVGEQIAAAWPEGVSAVDAIREQRREL